MVFLTFFIIPLLICIFSWILTKKITWQEALLQLVVQAAFVGIMLLFIFFKNNYDLEIWNGNITKKKSVRVSCEHSYKCNCRTVKSCSGSGKSKSCTTHTKCDTCYEHSYDVDWRVYDSTGEYWNIKRIDRRGLKEPSRWTQAQIGEPTASTHFYINYIKGSPDSLFKTGKKNTKYKNLPEYPTRIYDYYKLNRLVTEGVPVDQKKWNGKISEVASNVGNSKQANIVVILTKKSQEYFQVLRRHWLGGKKNDVITVIGVDDNKNINWVEVMSLSNEEFKVKLRTELLHTKKLEMNQTLSTIENVVKKSFIRKPMKDFEYLKSAVQPTKAQWTWGMILSFILSVVLSVVFYKTDPFGTENRYY